MPVLTKEPWFGPKRVLGWGWRPIAPPGWIVTFAAVALIVVCLLTLPRQFKFVGVAGVAAVLIATMALTGTPIGGPDDSSHEPPTD